MSARTTRTIAAAVASAALLGSAALAFPASANAAAAKVPPAAAVKISVASEYKNEYVQPGNGGTPLIVTAQNPTDKPQSFGAVFRAQSLGPLFQGSGTVIGQVNALGKTPATGFSTWQNSIQFLGAFYPKGHRGGEFTIPAHTTWTWKLELAATKMWPMNDATLRVDVDAYQNKPAGISEATTYLRVGKNKPGGTINETITGGSKIVKGKYTYETVTVTNHTGWKLTDWRIAPSIFAQGKQPLGFEIDEWVSNGYHGRPGWMPVRGSYLTVNDLKSGGSAHINIRIRLTGDKPVKAAERVLLQMFNLDGFSTPGYVFKNLVATPGA